MSSSEERGLRIDSTSEIKYFDSIQSIDERCWGQLTSPNFPFNDYAYLRALEKSGCVGGDTGWSPLYVTAWRAGELEGATLLFEKQHSYGEYIFDWAWADAYQRYNIPYFPKLTSAIPFTPATGPKLLFSASADRDTTARQMLEAATDLATKHGFSSLHYLFLEATELPYFEKHGFLIRHSFQYHWKNNEYSSWANFLKALKPRKRRQILRERSQLNDEGLTFRWLTGDELSDDHALLFHQMYLATIQKMQATAYLNLDFFKQVFASMKDSIHLVLAEQNGAFIAGALYYHKGNTLYGRYWGALKEVRNLHFELCYYQSLDWAIEQKVRLVEAGAQGEHKIARGFLPQLTYSAHWIAHPAFRAAISSFIEEEKGAIERVIGDLNGHSPFR